MHFCWFAKRTIKHRVEGRIIRLHRRDVIIRIANIASFAFRVRVEKRFDLVTIGDKFRFLIVPIFVFIDSIQEGNANS